MRLHLHRPIHLSYCTNVHPGATWPETLANLRRYTLAIRERVAPGRPFGIGLWLSDAASRELEAPRELEEFKRLLDEWNCYVFTLNAFPFGVFHRAKVKESVFAPDWTRPERLDYTRRCARILARLLPESVEGSLSTVPGSFGEWIRTPDERAAIVHQLADCAWDLEELSRAEGRELSLGLEPEPMGYLETAKGLAQFFEEGLRVEGARRIASSFGVSQDDARGIIDRRLAMCYDTCHMALQYDEPEDCLARLGRSRVRINKFQISSALRCVPTERALAELARFADGVYLHQVIARERAGGLHVWRDLDVALADRARLLEAEELRVHCHVPLHWSPEGALGATSDHIVALLGALRDGNDTAHFEIETYTWDVLPSDVRGGGLVEAVAAEFRWLLERLAD